MIPPGGSPVSTGQRRTGRRDGSPSRLYRYNGDGLLCLTGASESGATTNTSAYGYDLVGNRTSAPIDDGTSGSQPAPTSRSSNAANQVTGWEYDLVGNRTSAPIDDGTGGSQPAPTSRSSNAANQVTGWEYDAAGNLLSDGTTTSTYDALNYLRPRSRRPAQPEAGNQ
jgi:hypothetical protein